MVEGGGLESRCAVLPYRGFESHPLRHYSLPQTHKIYGDLQAFSMLELFVVLSLHCIANLSGEWTRESKGGVLKTYFSVPCIQTYRSL